MATYDYNLIDVVREFHFRLTGSGDDCWTDDAGNKLEWLRARVARWYPRKTGGFAGDAEEAILAWAKVVLDGIDAQRADAILSNPEPLLKTELSF